MFINPTTLAALTLKKHTSIPVAEAYQADNHDTWVNCPRCGRYHRFTADEYPQGMLAAKCEDGDPFAKSERPSYYYVHIEGLATLADVSRFLKHNAKRQRESDALQESATKQAASRAKIEASRKR